MIHNDNNNVKKTLISVYINNLCQSHEFINLPNSF